MNHIFENLIYRSRHQELAVKDQNFSCIQGVSCSHNIRWRGKTAPTFSTSDPLPDGYTLSSAGVLSYDGTACTPDTYAFSVTADDGETTVTATMTVAVAQAVISFSAQSFKFKIGESGTENLVATADTTPITFAVSSGTLPTGVSLASDGTLTYDGTTTAETEVNVSVTASAPFCASVTATIGLELSEHVIPKDYVFWAPLKTDLLDHSTAARTQSAAGASGGDERSGITLTTKDGIACTYVPRYARLLYTPRSGINIGNTSRTESIWLNCAFNVSVWNVALCTGQNSMYQLFALGWNSRRVAFGGYNNDRYSDVTMTANTWHHIAVTYDTSAIKLYLDGELVLTNVQSNQVNTADSDVCVGGRPTSSDNGCDAAYFCDARIYNRALSADEIQELASENLFVNFASQTAKFYGNKGASIVTLSASPSGCTFALTSGTLPSGVTLSSAGLLAYDGTTISQDSSTDVTIKASKSGYNATSATVTIEMYVEQIVPNDYVWYTPFTNNYTEETSGITGVPYQQNAFSIATDSSMFGTGYLAARKTTSDTKGIEWANTATYMDLSAGNITISLWLRAPNWGNYTQLLGGTRSADRQAGFVLFKDLSTPCIDFRSASNYSRSSTNVNVDSEWHHWLFTRTAQGAWTWYKDGVQVTSGTGDTGSINGSYQNMKIGGGSNWSKQAYFDLAHFRVYNRVLDSSEIDSLANEFADTPILPTDEFKSYPLSSDLKDAKHSSDTDYDLTKPTTASVTYSTYGGISGAVVSNGCLYNTFASGARQNGCALSAWTKFLNSPASSSTLKVFVNGSNSTSAGFWLGYKSGVYVAGWSTTAGITTSVSTNASWHHLLLNYDKNTLTVDYWIDGVKAGTATLNSALNNGAGTVINAIYGANSNPEAENDNNTRYADVKYFSRTLSTGEILGLAGEH